MYEPDRHTHTHRHDIGRACIASRGKNKTETILEKRMNITGCAVAPALC